MVSVVPSWWTTWLQYPKRCMSPVGQRRKSVTCCSSRKYRCCEIRWWRSMAVCHRNAGLRNWHRNSFWMRDCRCCTPSWRRRRLVRSGAARWSQTTAPSPVHGAEQHRFGKWLRRLCPVGKDTVCRLKKFRMIVAALYRLVTWQPALSTTGWRRECDEVIS